MSSGRTRQHPPMMRAPAAAHRGASSADQPDFADPRSALAVPLFAAVGVDDDGLARRLPGHHDRVLDVAGRAAIHPHRNDFRHVGGHRERVGERLPCARRRPGDRVGQPRRNTELVNEADERLGLVDVGHRLQRQHVGSGVGEDLQPRPMPVRQLRDRQAVAPDVLLAVGQRRAVRPDGRGHPPSRSPPHLVAGRRRELDAAPQQPVGVVSSIPRSANPSKDAW